MLVLTRKIGESIQIGNQVTVEVLEMRGGRIRLGITAPQEVIVQRSEIIEPDQPPVTRQSLEKPLMQRCPVVVSGS